MAIDTTRILGEEGLIGTVVNSSLSTTGLTVYAQFRDAKTGAARTPDAGTLMFVIDKDNERFEIIQADSHSTASGITTITINASGRALPRYGTGAGSGTGLAHDIGASIGSVILARPMNELAAAAAAKGGDVLTGPLTGPVYANAAARDAAIPTPANGDCAYLTAEGHWTDYIAGAWVSRATGATPNASETVAGKAEQGTLAEQKAQTETGTTGAPLFMSPKNTAVSSTGALEGHAVLLNASKQVDSSLLDQSKVAFFAKAGEAVDGSATPQLVNISDGTNARTAGSFYRCDANDATSRPYAPYGFICENAATIGTAYAVKRGLISGFTGLTPGAWYYSSGTAGGITATAAPMSTPLQRLVGIAISDTELQTVPMSRETPFEVFGSASSVAIGAEVSVNNGIIGVFPKQATFTLYMSASDSGGVNTDAAVFVGSTDGNSYRGCRIRAADVTALTYAPVVTAGGAGNRSSLTATFQLNAFGLVVKFQNTIVGGTGSSVTSYNVTATGFPY